MLKTPKDDWELSSGRPFDIMGENGEPTMQLRFNMLHPMNQVARRITRQYENGGYHIYRFIEILAFQRDNFDRLVADGLAMSDGAFRRELHEALCVLPYSEQHTEAGGDCFRFSYAEVVAKANELRTNEPR